MTDLPKRLVQTLQRRRRAAETWPRRGIPGGPMDVAIHLPGGVPSTVADDLCTTLDEQLHVMLSALGIDRTPTITTSAAPAGATHATVSIDQRPVAHLGPDELRPEDPSEVSASHHVVSRVQRRLPLLGGCGIAPRSTAAYLMLVGCRITPDTPVDRLYVEDAEQRISDRSDEHIVLWVAVETMRPGAGADAASVYADAAAVAELRDAEFERSGVIYPDIRVELTDAPPGVVRLQLNDVRLPERNLGNDAGWADVVAHVRRELASRRHWFVRMHHIVRHLTQDLRYVLPELVAVSEENYPLAQIAACMRELVQSGRRMRNIARILWLLLEAGGPPAGRDILRISEAPLLPKVRRRAEAAVAADDPIVQAIRVRKLAAEEDWQHGNHRPLQHPVRLAADIEDRLLASNDIEALARAEWAAVRALSTKPEARYVVTRSVHALAPVRAALQAVERVPRVVASHELPPDSNVAAVPILSDPELS